jgi:hypothetical protein
LLKVFVIAIQQKYLLLRVKLQLSKGYGKKLTSNAEERTELDNCVLDLACA